MTIKFKTVDGQFVETTDKNVLILAAKNGDITPESVVTVDDKSVRAGRIKGLVFGAPPISATKPEPNPEPVERKKTTSKNINEPKLDKTTQRAADTILVCHWALCILAILGNVVLIISPSPLGFIVGAAGVLGTLIYFMLGNAIIKLICRALEKNDAETT